MKTQWRVQHLGERARSIALGVINRRGRLRIDYQRGTLSMNAPTRSSREIDKLSFFPSRGSSSRSSRSLARSFVRSQGRLILVHLQKIDFANANERAYSTGRERPARALFLSFFRRGESERRVAIEIHNACTRTLLLLRGGRAVENVRWSENSEATRDARDFLIFWENVNFTL